MMTPRASARSNISELGVAAVDDFADKSAKCAVTALALARNRRPAEGYNAGEARRCRVGGGMRLRNKLSRAAQNRLGAVLVLILPFFKRKCKYTGYSRPATKARPTQRGTATTRSPRRRHRSDQRQRGRARAGTIAVLPLFFFLVCLSR